jgi:hypothetical protein
MEEITFGDKIKIWKTKYNFKNKDLAIKDCYKRIEQFPDIKNDAYPYYQGIFKTSSYFNEVIENELDEIRNFGIDRCSDLYGEDYDEIITDIWINIVRIDPKQLNFTIKEGLVFHAHTDLNRKAGKVMPYYTFVIYVQMPNNLSGDDGVLYLKDSDGNIFTFLPEEGDCIIMDGDLLHVPGYAKNSSVDRLVLAGNTTFQKRKTNKTLL